MLSSSLNTGSTDLRDTEVQQPNTTETLSLLISSRALSANSAQFEAGSTPTASSWPLCAEKARELISKDKVSVVFGCWTSVSRKSVLPVFKELDSILFYPVQYEGEESE